ncbi:MAG TPA: glycosyltransferase family 39 protein [Pyrinomonadaceae bacterium]|nr:glycosyltransferase family 39 protein [Pyrinomonadaceae bacterium]
MRARRVILLALFAAAVLLRVADTFRPLDRASWRESDIGSISRNFTREGMDPLYPRIDWRGTGPGYAEMELPLYPWTIAVVYEAFGMHDEAGRIISLLLSLGALALFWFLARDILEPNAAIAAFALFAFNPLIFEISTAVQPEGLTMLAYLGAAYFFARWMRTERLLNLFTAAAFTSLSILAKATSAHIGLLFAILWFRKEGVAAFKNWRVYAFASIALIPGVLWYIHAKSLWLMYGNSLGVSNEYHWIGFDFFTNSYFILGILSNEVLWVWGGIGVIVALVGIVLARREKAVSFSLVWLASVFVFLIVAARTTADDWANYYHVFAVAPASLLIGVGAGKGVEMFGDLKAKFTTRKTLAALIVFASAAAFVFDLRAIRSLFLAHRLLDPAFAESREIEPYLRRDGLILVSGGACVDRDGYALAFNASYMFYWLDRKGFNICSDRQTVAAVEGFRSLGAQYFVAQKSELAHTVGFEAEVASRFPTAIETNEFIVFDLRP